MELDVATQMKDQQKEATLFSSVPKNLYERMNMSLMKLQLLQPVMVLA